MENAIVELLGQVEIVVGIDASLNGAAFCVMKDEKKYDLARHAAQPPANTLPLARLERFIEHADAIVADIASRVKKKRCLVIIEGYVDSGYGGTSLVLAEFGGILRRKLYESLDIVLLLEPTTGSMKKFVCGNGGGDKTRTIAYLARYYDLPVDLPDSDRYDAFGLALVGMGLRGRMKVTELTPDRQQILEDLFVTKKKKRQAKAIASAERKLRLEQAKEAKAAAAASAKSAREAARDAKAAERKAKQDAAASAKAAKAVEKAKPEAVSVPGPPTLRAASRAGRILKLD